MLTQSDTIGPRLKVARERSGLTQQQLADALGLRHRQTIASIEAGDRRLSAVEMIAAMQVLGVDLDYLTDPFRLVGEGQFSFRTTGAVEPDVLNRFEEQAGRWIALYRELSQEAGDPPRWLGYKLNLNLDSSFEDAQAAGEAAADRWDLGCRPADRLRSVMENRLHVLVLYVDAPPGVSGAASRVPGLNCALVNREESEGRRNFDLAHELFHLLTWDALPPERTATVDASLRGKRWRVEKLADSFAGALLLPRETLTRAWEATSAVEGVQERLNAVAGEMRVSAPVCKWRLRNLQLLSGVDVEVVDDRLHGAKRRPECWTSDPLPFSREFIRLVALASNTGRLSVKRTARLLDMSMARLATVFRAHGQETYSEA